MIVNQSVKSFCYYLKKILNTIILNKKMNFVLGNECTPCMSKTTSYLHAGHRILLPPFLEFLIGSDLLSKIFWQQTWHKLWLHGKSTTGGFSLSRHSWQLVILSYLTSEKFSSILVPKWTVHDPEYAQVYSTNKCCVSTAVICILFFRPGDQSHALSYDLF